MAQPKSKRQPQPDPIAERIWVEELAMLFEAFSQGFPRTAGRVLGRMLISEQASTTQAELAEALSVSQASVSPALRFLIETGYLEKTRIPGVRSDHYRLRDQLWTTMMRSAALTADSFIRHFERGLELPGPDLSPGRAQLMAFAGFFRQLQSLLFEAAETGGKA